jgi:hypothetical protein
VDHNSFRYKVLVALYETKVGTERDGGRSRSMWWRQLVGICREDSLSVGRWFDDNLATWWVMESKRSFGQIRG